MVGTSGSGKSTLASLLVRFWEPQRGNITLGDIPLAQYPKEQLRQLIGVVEQDTFLFSATVRENLRLACPDATEQQLEQALAFAELTDVIAALPEGLDTALGDNGYRLSGGQRQRLALARAWLRDCPIVVLDEIFQGLDVRTASILRRRIAQWGKAARCSISPTVCKIWSNWTAFMYWNRELSSNRVQRRHYCNKRTGYFIRCGSWSGSKLALLWLPITEKRDNMFQREIQGRLAIF